MTYRLPNAKTITSVTRDDVRYSLFVRVTGTKQWKRIANNSYSERIAWVVYQQRILKAPLSYSIRPVKPESTEAQSRLSRFRTAKAIPDLRTYGI